MPAAAGRNTQKRTEIPSAQRWMIVGQLTAGATTREVAEYHSRSQRAIQKLWKLYTTTGTTDNLPRSGRPPVLSDTQKKLLHREARKNPRITYAELSKAACITAIDSTTTPPPSRSTIYRALKKLQLRCHRAKKRPKLTRKHALQRLIFSRKWRTFP
jgi:hypothetical protein